MLTSSALLISKAPGAVSERLGLGRDGIGPSDSLKQPVMGAVRNSSSSRARLVKISPVCPVLPMLDAPLRIGSCSSSGSSPESVGDRKKERPDFAEETKGEVM